jgi:hypothetical protein
VGRAMKIKLHVAAIEWSDESCDVTLFAGNERFEVQAQIREVIEGSYTEADREYEEVADYVLGPGLDEPDWETWHSAMHEIDGTPWVTFKEIEVELDG